MADTPTVLVWHRRQRRDGYGAPVDTWRLTELTGIVAAAVKPNGYHSWVASAFAAMGKNRQSSIAFPFIAEAMAWAEKEAGRLRYGGRDLTILTWDDEQLDAEEAKENWCVP